VPQRTTPPDSPIPSVEWTDGTDPSGDAAARLLTKPRAGYTRIQPNNLAKLRHAIRKGDVVLVDGDQRVSEVIKYLTQSSWSHAAIYVGESCSPPSPATHGARRALRGGR
jgi:hypothetical protein